MSNKPIVKVSPQAKQPVQMQAAQLIHQEQISHYSGPIPAAVEMARYKELSPDFPDRIMKMAEFEQQSRLEGDRQDSRRKDIELNINNRNTLLGLFFAFGTVLVIMLAACYCASINQPLPASLIGTGGIFLIVSVFITGSKLKSSSVQKEKSSRQ